MPPLRITPPHVNLTSPGLTNLRFAPHARR
jgi:hypothetical protein